jgi:Skp family chaperone for outer membrane proteins
MMHVTWSHISQVASLTSELEALRQKRADEIHALRERFTNLENELQAKESELAQLQEGQARSSELKDQVERLEKELEEAKR